MPIHLAFDLTGLDTLQRKLDSALNRLVKESCAATAKVVKARAKQGPFKDRTRQLRSTINDIHIGLRGGWYLVEVRAPQKHASWVELGTKPHDIPKPARPPGKPLHFYWEKRGVWFTGFGVHHPGGKPYPFMTPATIYGQAYIVQFAQRGLSAIAAQLESYG